MDAEREQPGSQPFARLVIHFTVFFIFLAMVALALAGEVFTLRTGSMEPTLLGRPQGGDSVFVSSFFGTPGDARRFDILRFSHPNNRRASYMKRLIGLPGDQIFIRGGDIYLSDASFGGTLEEGIEMGRVAILRKPDRLQADIFAAFPVVPEAVWSPVTDAVAARHFRCIPQDAIQIEDGCFRIHAEEEARIELQRSVFDFAPDSGQGDPATRDRSPVGDLAFELDVAGEGGTGAVFIEIFDPWLGGPVAAVLDLDDGSASLLRNGKPLGQARLRGVPGDFNRFRFENVDDRLRIFFRGRLLVERHYSHLPAGASAELPATVSFGVRRGTCRVRPAGLYRDIHYLPGKRDRYLVGEGQGFFLGDHAARSADSREWERVAIYDLDAGKILEGDMAGATVHSLVLQPSNPWQDADGTWVFSDLDGTLHRFSDSRRFLTLGRRETPFASLATVRGRAMAVVWPPGRMRWLR